MPSFFYFNLFICPPNVKRPTFSGVLAPELPPGLHHEQTAELTSPQDPYLHFTTFKNSIFAQKTDISKTVCINACMPMTNTERRKKYPEKLKEKHSSEDLRKKEPDRGKKK